MARSLVLFTISLLGACTVNDTSLGGPDEAASLPAPSNRKPLPKFDDGDDEASASARDAGEPVCRYFGHSWDGRDLATNVPCTYQLPSSTSGFAIDPYERTVVASTIANGAEAGPGDRVDGHYKAGAEACGDDYGWYFDPPPADRMPSSGIAMCPRSCNVAQQPTTWVRIDIEFLVCPDS